MNIYIYIYIYIHIHIYIYIYIHTYNIHVYIHAYHQEETVTRKLNSDLKELRAQEAATSHDLLEVTHENSQNKRHLQDVLDKLTTVSN